MPPKRRITKEMILHTVLEITREKGFEEVNARSIAGRLQCSTRPVFTCYENMEQLKKDFLEFAFDFYTQYVSHYESAGKTDACLLFPLSYVEFAREEPLLFRYLFMDDMDLKMRRGKDFYEEPGNEQKARKFSEMAGLDITSGKAVFLDLFLYSHGIAVLTASGKLFLAQEETEKMLRHMAEALIRGEKPGERSSLQVYGGEGYAE